MGWKFAVLAAGLFLASSVPSGAAHHLAGAARPIGAGANGQHAFEFTGRIDQNGNALVSYGYLTHVQGLPDASLFTSPTNTLESTARFTLYGSASVTGRAVNSGIFNLGSTGTLTVYFNPAAGADFNNPTSFKRGTAIATIRTRQQSIVTVIAPNQGLLTASGEATQTRAGTFSLQAKQYTFGRGGLREAVTITGLGIRSQPSPPVATFAIAGNNSVTG